MRKFDTGPKGVYAIFHNSEKKVYIGSSQDVNKRRNKHLSDLKSGNHPNAALQFDFNEDNDCFSFEVLETYGCSNHELRKHECAFMDEYLDEGYLLYNGNLSSSRCEYPYFMVRPNAWESVDLSLTDKYEKIIESKDSEIKRLTKSLEHTEYLLGVERSINESKDKRLVLLKENYENLEEEHEKLLKENEDSFPLSEKELMDLFLPVIDYSFDKCYTQVKYALKETIRGYNMRLEDNITKEFKERSLLERVFNDSYFIHKGLWDSYETVELKKNNELMEKCRESIMKELSFRLSIERCHKTLEALG